MLLLFFTGECNVNGWMNDWWLGRSQTGYKLWSYALSKIQENRHLVTHAFQKLYKVVMFWSWPIISRCPWRGQSLSYHYLSCLQLSSLLLSELEKYPLVTSSAFFLLLSFLSSPPCTITIEIHECFRPF
jgi:hypothetical protein